MPTAVEHSVKPLERTAAPDLSVDITGMPHLPAAVDVRHEHTNKALTLNFALAGDVNGDGTLHLDIQLLVPAVHTDFLLG
jgi:hypothetical protein